MANTPPKNNHTIATHFYVTSVCVCGSVWLPANDKVYQTHQESAWQRRACVVYWVIFVLPKLPSPTCPCLSDFIACGKRRRLPFANNNHEPTKLSARIGPISGCFTYRIYDNNVNPYSERVEIYSKLWQNAEEIELKRISGYMRSEHHYPNNRNTTLFAVFYVDFLSGSGTRDKVNI